MHFRARVSSAFLACFCLRSSILPSCGSLAYRVASPSLRGVRGVSMSSPVKAKDTAKEVVSLHWFRKGLRLHDNPALVQACKDATQVYPVFVLDPFFANPETVGVNRYRFLLQALSDLDRSLRALGSRLYVVQGSPLEVLPLLVQRLGVNRLTFEADTEPYAKKRDVEVVCAVHALTGEGVVSVVSVGGHTLHDMKDYTHKCSNHKHTGQVVVPVSYQRFLSLFHSMPPVPQVAPLVDASLLPPASANAKSGIAEADMTVPSLTQMGYTEPSLPARYVGGETEALDRLRRVMLDKKAIAQFEKPKTAPNSLEPSTTVLSPYLKFGCLSPRLFYHTLQQVYAECKGQHSKPPVSLLGQLLWREFFYLCGEGVPNFDKMQGNPICKQIPWRRDAELLAAWKEARTGYPFIDAIMTQLRKEGWIHHLARHAVACFLTRGDLYQHWEEGVKVFDQYLLDADWSLNNGNWLWLSASAFFFQFFRVYSPVVFGAKTDKEGAYIRKYLPQLAHYPNKYIYEPWKAPMSVQESSGCIIGVHYPKPIVDHATASKENIARHKAAYDAGKGIITAGSEDKEEEEEEGEDEPPSDHKGKGKAKTSAAKRSASGTKPLESFFPPAPSSSDGDTKKKAKR